MIQIYLDDKEALELYKLLSLIGLKEISELSEGMVENFININYTNEVINDITQQLEYNNINLNK